MVKNLLKYTIFILVILFTLNFILLSCKGDTGQSHTQASDLSLRAYQSALDAVRDSYPGSELIDKYNPDKVREGDADAFQVTIEGKEGNIWSCILKYNKEKDIFDILELVQGTQVTEAEEENVAMKKQEEQSIEEQQNNTTGEETEDKIIDVKVIKDIEYSNYDFEGKKASLLLDLYLPDEQSNGPYPLIIYIHGGSWMEGDKTNCPGEEIAALGYCMASVNYRLSDVSIFPAQIHDIKEAVRWLRENASLYNIDPDAFAAWGVSAGGHLSALLGTSSGVVQLESERDNHDISSSIQAVCDFYGPTDFTEIDLAFDEEISESVFEKYGDRPLFEITLGITKLLGGPVKEHLDLAKLANPITHIDKTDPPFLIYHGESDVIVPVSQSELLADKLKENNVHVTFIKNPDGGHSFQGPGGEPFDPKLIKMGIDFFDSVFK